MAVASVAVTANESFQAVEVLLGGRRVLRVKPQSTLDWIKVIRQGIPASAFGAMTKAINLSSSELARTLGIPERTLARRKREGILSSEESAKLVRLARAVGRANEVFEDPEAALHWLKAPNAALSGASPLSVLDTEIGAESVFETLGRIEHGVYA
jgi:putative toxin-antitoxin system antitoxin component (TIGR02293 family)